MPSLPPGDVRDRRDATLPDASARAFWLDGSAWEYPDFENVDGFVARLARRGLLARDPIVDDALLGRIDPRTIRCAQRHFLRATGISHREVIQIERARHAAVLLRQGMPILDVVHEVGYFDQAHLTRSLTRRIGQTPRAIGLRTEQLSFLYKRPARP